jgi:hypothetical protein
MCAFYHIAFWTNGYIQFPHLAPIMNRTNGELVGCLKYVKDGEKEKGIEILQYFAGLPSESEFNVQPLCAPFWHLACYWRVNHRHASGREPSHFFDR